MNLCALFIYLQNDSVSGYSFNLVLCNQLLRSCRVPMVLFPIYQFQGATGGDPIKLVCKLRGDKKDRGQKIQQTGEDHDRAMVRALLSELRPTKYRSGGPRRKISNKVKLRLCCIKQLKRK